MDSSAIFLVYRLRPTQNGISRRLLAKVGFEGEKIHVLENHGLLEDLENLSPEKADRVMDSFAFGQRTEVVCLEDIEQGRRPDLIPSIENTRHSPIFRHEPMALYYEHPEFGTASIDIHPDKVYLNGNLLSEDESARIMENVKTGKATLSHRPREESAKDTDLRTALGDIKGAVSSGALSPEALKTVSRHLFTDSMVPSVGNRKAYQDFMSRPRDGIFVSIDGNDFGDINKKYGFESGDEAIKALFSAIRSSLDESVGRAKGKLYRKGGDEAFVFVPTPEDARAFCRVLSKKLQEAPHHEGTHALSACVGYGPTPEKAEQSLIFAKTAKRESGRSKGQADTHVAAWTELPDYSAVAHSLHLADLP